MTYQQFQLAGQVCILEIIVLFYYFWEQLVCGVRGRGLDGGFHGLFVQTQAYLHWGQGSVLLVLSQHSNLFYFYKFVLYLTLQIERYNIQILDKVRLESQYLIISFFNKGNSGYQFIVTCYCIKVQIIMKVIKRLSPLDSKVIQKFQNPHSSQLQESIVLLTKCVGELASTVTKMVALTPRNLQNSQISQVAEDKNQLSINKQKHENKRYSQKSDREILTKHNVKSTDSYQVQERFKEINVDVPNINGENDDSFSEQLLNWLGNVCKTVISVGFMLLRNQSLQVGKVKAYCSENIIRNILKFSQKYKLQPKHFQLINKCLQTQLLPYFLLKYPQTEQRDTSKKFSSLLISRDDEYDNQTDLVFKSGAQFEYQADGNYNSQIMQFINYIIKLPNQLIDHSETKDVQGKYTLFQSFEKDVESIFRMIELQNNKINMLKFDPKSLNILVKNAQATRGISNNDQKENKGKKDNKKQSGHSENQQNTSIKKKEKKERQQQEYRQKVKSYTNYQINSKLSLDFTTFSGYQIGNGNLYLSNSAIMRVVTKWCEQLQKCFNPKNILERQVKFRMKDGSQKYLNKIQMEVLNLMLQREKQKIDQKLRQIQKNNYEHQSNFSNAKIGSSLLKFSESQSLVGQYTSIIFKINENYLINYLNLLIAGINNAAQSFGKFRDYQTYLDGQRQADQLYQQLIQGVYNQQTLKRIEGHINVHVLSAKKAVFKTPQLITFTIGDLMRCKCTSKENEIIALYKQMQKINYENPKLFKIVRLKDRLNQGSKDILINLLYRQTLLVEMQLAIKSDKSKFIECSNNLNHYLYELKRAEFGPIAEMCSIWSSQDFRSKFYLQKLNQFTKRNDNQLKRGTDMNMCCTKIKNTKVVRLPFTCNACKCLYFHCSFSEKHILCSKCKKHTCFLCQVETFPKEMMRKLLPELNIHEKIKIEQVQFLKQLPEKGGGIMNLKSKHRKLLIFNTVKYQGQTYLFQNSNKLQDRNLIYKFKSDKLPFNFLKQNLIVNTYQILQDQPELSSPKLNITEFIPQYLRKCNEKEKKSVFLLKKQLNEINFSDILSTKGKLKQKKWLTVQNLILSENEFSQLGQLTEVFPNVKSLVLNRNYFFEFVSQSIGNWQNLKQLYLSKNNIRYLDQILQSFKQLTLLDISANKINQIPPIISDVKNLTYLNIMENYITHLDSNFYKLENLQILIMKNNKISQLNEQLCQMKSLVELNVSLNQLQKLPSNLGKLKLLTKFSISVNEYIRTFPDSFGDLESLYDFQLGATSLDTFPESFGSLKNLVSLHCGSSMLRVLPQSFGSLASLSEFYAGYTQIAKLPQSFGDLKKLSILYLRHSQLQSLPESFGKLSSLVQLRINGTNLEALPDSFGDLQNLRQLYINNLSITKLPDSFCKLRSLFRLDIYETQLQQLPQNFGHLQQLSILDLNQTNISSLPPTFFNLRGLTSLNLNYTKLTQLPEQFGSLDNLSQLYCRGMQNLNRLPESFEKLQILKILDINESYNLEIQDTLVKISKLDMLQTLQLYISDIDSTKIPLKEFESLKNLQLYYRTGNYENVLIQCQKYGIKVGFIG